MNTGTRYRANVRTGKRHPNAIRADQAAQTLAYYRVAALREPGASVETVLSDFLTDLRHYCARMRHDLATLERMAQLNDLQEKNERLVDKRESKRRSPFRLPHQHNTQEGLNMARKNVSHTPLNQAPSLHCVPLFRLQVVQEPHSPLYGVPKLMASRDVRNLVKAHFEGRPHEEFLVVFLDAKHRPTGYQVISVGSLTLSIVEPREVFKAAVCMNAAAVLCVHNHPSGDPTPSQEDRALTKRLVESGNLLGIRVLDHVVMGDDRYVSFADEGWL